MPNSVYTPTPQNPSYPASVSGVTGTTTYVVGSANRLAHAASLSVAERPGTQHTGGYNPLFLYGGTGLGKTHLLHAIGNAIVERAPKRRVLYITGEAFNRWRFPDELAQAATCHHDPAEVLSDPLIRAVRVGHDIAAVLQGAEPHLDWDSLTDGHFTNRFGFALARAHN